MGWKLFRTLRWATDSTKPAINKEGALLWCIDTKRLWVNTGSGWVPADCLPIGATYIRFPGKSDPATLWPNTTWSNISSETLLKGRVPRIEGTATYGSAATFGSSQEDQGQGHAHTTGATGQAYNGSAIAVGAKMLSTDGNSGSLQSQVTVGAPTSDGTNGTPRVGTETRVASVTVQVWQRTA